MSCCRRNRTVALTEWHRVAVRYSGGRTLAVTGPVTGSEYIVSGARRIVWMDPRDALVLTRTRLFSLDGAAPGHTSGA
ncbi:hypothetical protein AWB75_06206 [Caballeronia catudaia]|uniref:Uncharacterized protein n=1 Tax=Caballeronia catudaia TaxID=1777136 RepID=A0A158D632_9BURK|nr:hypothetical protein [Caballeronia catudaia]SAK89676.1 hypothetical protein AWB75_06206 [Caballeronia catudaia]